ncbi:MAG: hypothetical protein GX101_07280 [Firmicutes bacterium]|nr:hypothetical protein [Bacillota bacterium]NLO66478.1 hypothetical protein [Bacillota bacterium]
MVGFSKLMGRTVSVAPSLLIKRRRALGIFERELYALGLDHESVQELKAAYRELGSIQDWVFQEKE